MRTLKHFKNWIRAAIVLCPLGLYAADDAVTFTTNTVGFPLLVTDGTDFTYSVSGSFTGTATLERSFDGKNFEGIKTFSTSATGQLNSSNPGHGVAYYRFRSKNVGGSESIVTDLKNVPKVYFQRYDEAGQLVYQFDESGLTVTGVNASGAVTIGSGTSTKHTLNTLLGTNGSGTAAMPNLPSGVATNSIGWIKIKINGTDSYIPFWQ